MYDYVQIVDKKLYYNQGYIVVFFLLGDSPASEFCVPTFRNTLYLSIFIGGVSRKSLPAYTTNSAPERLHIKFRRRGITQKKEYCIRNTAKV
jgi:hypothetical protein